MVFNNVGEIFDFIDNIRAEITKEVSSLSAEELNFRPREDSWTIAEIVEHLGKTETGITMIFLKLLKKAEAENLSSDGNFNAPISFVEQARASSAVKIEAPEQVRPTGSASLEASLTVLQKSRETLAALHPRFENFDHSASRFPHPFFGEINLYQWLAVIGLHDARHLNQIRNILAEREKQLKN